MIMYGHANMAHAIVRKATGVSGIGCQQTAEMPRMGMIMDSEEEQALEVGKSMMIFLAFGDMSTVWIRLFMVCGMGCSH